MYVTTSVSSTGIFDPRLSISIKILKNEEKDNENMNTELYFSVDNNIDYNNIVRIVRELIKD